MDTYCTDLGGLKPFTVLLGLIGIVSVVAILLTYPNSPFNIGNKNNASTAACWPLACSSIFAISTLLVSVTHLGNLLSACGISSPSAMIIVGLLVFSCISYGISMYKKKATQPDVPEESNAT